VNKQKDVNVLQKLEEKKQQKNNKIRTVLIRKKTRRKNNLGVARVVLLANPNPSRKVALAHAHVLVNDHENARLLATVLPHPSVWRKRK
jgi:hypothetical protein